MDDQTRARRYYEAAGILFQDPVVEDCEIVIELLEKGLNIHADPDIQELIENAWYYLLKSLDPENDSKAYEKYMASPAWRRKRDQVIEHNKGKCAWCGAEGKQVHHKTYDNIGRELLSELEMLCGKCHKEEHHPPVPSDQQSVTQHTSPVPSDSQAATQQPLATSSGKVSAKEAFIAYVKRESDVLQYSDAEGSVGSDYVNYESGYPTKNGFPEIQLSAWLPVAWNDVAAVISIQSDSKYFESHYKKLEAHKAKIEETFSFDEVKFRSSKGGKMYHLRVVKKGVDLTQIAEWDAAFRWLRENLEKLYWVLRVPDILGWDNT